MDRSNPYYRQVELLIRLLPFVFQEPCFALKGGTAINLFVRNFPRLSVDIDLVYLPDGDRDDALAAVHAALDRVAMAIEKAFSGVALVKSYEQKPDALRLIVTHQNASVKIELSPVLRGSVHVPVNRVVVAGVEREFGFAEGLVLAHDDLYAGKICAALDRQHPRDLFDILLLLENEGISDSLRKTALVYLLSHSRPIHELLAPRWRSLQSMFEGDFDGMAFRNVTVEELAAAGRQLLNLLLGQMTDSEQRFLYSVYDEVPDWSALGWQHVHDLPAVKWKLMNIARMTERKRQAALGELRQIVGDSGK